jgi:hypothetical protein
LENTTTAIAIDLGLLSALVNDSGLRLDVIRAGSVFFSAKGLEFDMSLVGSLVLFRTISRGHDFGERLEPSSAEALRNLWKEIDEKCFKLYTRDPNNSLLYDVYKTLGSNIKQCKRDLTDDPEQQHMQDCHRGIEALYGQCREASLLGDVEDADPSAWSSREVVFPPTRTTVASARD